ncbi:putative amidohydrolase [Gordonia hirsuta DSM 44140 = NBRC 16056]|uniref:Putative amidohydrolase n=1 Tax=Gordonia hirsuta DSM 44140 = NBRC 16056 TaxID=1121927 RepID=L7L6T1_9ACTN|nr:amidohydrolase [Gordonia hirsuta]GAC56629.1 putative amidohydrolase [Gordonia hirsuta DSM 44140 = NBRC 16056]
MNSLKEIYLDLHRHPELSGQEERTAGVVAGALTAAGYEVRQGLGGFGVTGVLRNGDGPTVWLRADMDALPVREETGLDYASTVTAVNDDGETVPVAHACGHDMHTTALIGAAAQLSATVDEWSGTVVAVFQPAEEDLSGAMAMVDGGLLDAVPHPDVVLGQHVAPGPAGMVFYHPGYTLAASDALQIRLFGRGGHGSRPETTVDPILMAAAVILRLQGIVGREVAATDQVVVSVGVVEAGTKSNIIPDEATLKLSVRTFDLTVREKVLAAITRIVRAEAMASGADREPEITTLYNGPATLNDDAALERVVAAFQAAFDGRVMEVPPGSGSEDFGRLGAAAGAPSVYWFLGGADPALFAPPADLFEVLAEIPSNHSPEYAPVIEPTLTMGVAALVTAARAWLAP